MRGVGVVLGGELLKLYMLNLQSVDILEVIHSIPLRAGFVLGTVNVCQVVTTMTGVKSMESRAWLGERSCV